MAATRARTSHVALPRWIVRAEQRAREAREGERPEEKREVEGKEEEKEKGDKQDNRIALWSSEVRLLKAPARLHLPCKVRTRCRLTSGRCSGTGKKLGAAAAKPPLSPVALH